MVMVGMTTNGAYYYKIGGTTCNLAKCRLSTLSAVVRNLRGRGKKQIKIPDKVPILCSVHAETFTEDGGGDVRSMVNDRDVSMSP
jgi:hypothetical protein